MNKFVAVLSVIFVMCSQLPTLAISEWDEDLDPHKTPQYRIERLEFGVLNQTFSQDEAFKRISRLEKELFGKQQGGAFTERLDRLETSYSGRDSKPKSGSLVQDKPNNNDPAREEKIQELISQAMAANEQQDYSKAKQLLANAIKLDPLNCNANFSMVAVLETEGKYKEAREYCQVAHRADPDDREVSQELAKLEKKLAGTRTLASTQSEIDLPGLKAEAKLAFGDGNYGTAVRDLEKVVCETPNDDVAQYALGEALWGKNDFDGAVYHIKKALAIKPDASNYKKELKRVQQQQDFLASNGKPKLVGNSNGGIVPIEPQAGGRRVFGSSITGLLIATAIGMGLGALAGSNQPGGWKTGAGYGGMNGVQWFLSPEY